MKAIVCDGEVLSHLQPSTVEAYLKATGWHERNRIPDKVSVWTRDSFSEDKLKIYVPLDLEFDDYPRRMYEIMETLEKAENRSQLDIVIAPFKFTKFYSNPKQIQATPIHH